MGQERLTQFGMQFRPMIGGSLINEGDVPLVSENNVDFAFEKQFGFSAGMVIRKGFTDMFSLETGLNYVQRNYNMRVDDPAYSYLFEQEFGVVGYEVPILGLIYIRLSKEIYMNTSFGFCTDIYPSDVAVFSRGDKIVMEGRRQSWVQGSLTANIGWEWRTPKSGSFYIGGTYHRSFTDSYGFLTEYDPDPEDPAATPVRALVKTNGNYLTLDFRYFFHEDPEKKKLRMERRK